jgi:predicted neutral ceramidase superfamily lipid hydrolase
MTEQEQMVVDCENRESKLSDWERTFIDSISRQLQQGKTLSEKQDAQLTKIWERVT